MPKPRYQKQETLASSFPAHSHLPTTRPIAIYYRQSTEAQVGNVSTSIQTVDMVAYLKRQGWAEDHIIMIDMDTGISGTKAIDERPGMSALFGLINAGGVGAVACQDEDRLFRDVTQIQVNIFIEACRTAQVLVITPSMVYDFAHEMTGTFHARQFRFKSEMAAEYISSVIRGKLHRARRRMLMDGLWAGTSVPSGFMVDTRRRLPDGGVNPGWRRYTLFEPYAEVVREYFRLFLSFGGNLRKTLRHIERHGPYYPDPRRCLPPEGFRVIYRMQAHDGRYRPGRTGLQGILTNAQYIGHWMVNGVVVRWDNHPALVDEETFMRAFNYLSSVTLEGRTNHRYRGVKENARPSKDELRPVERPLCAGLVVARHDGKQVNVGTSWVEALGHYTYVLWSTKNDKYVWGKAASFFDTAVSNLLQDKLAATFDQRVWEQTVTSFSKQLAEKRKLIQAQLSHLAAVMGNLVASLETLSHPAMIQATQERYEDAEAEHERLSRELRALADEEGRLAEIECLRLSVGPVLENWPKMSRDEKRVVLHAFVERIEAEARPGHALKLTVRWRDDTSDDVLLPRQATTGTHWLPEETAALLALVRKGAEELEIASAFPDRKWSQINNKVYRETGSGLSFKPKLIGYSETYWEYVEGTGECVSPNSGSGVLSGTTRRGGPARSPPAGARHPRRRGRHS
jgi:DNA invertase Pin-like site-specific DNA recombinase